MKALQHFRAAGPLGCVLATLALRLSRIERNDGCSAEGNGCRQRLALSVERSTDDARARHLRSSFVQMPPRILGEGCDPRKHELLPLHGVQQTVAHTQARHKLAVTSAARSQLFGADTMDSIEAVPQFRRLDNSPDSFSIYASHCTSRLRRTRKIEQTSPRFHHVPHLTFRWQESTRNSYNHTRKNSHGAKS